jgi:hypothetical protein
MPHQTGINTFPAAASWPRELQNCRSAVRNNAKGAKHVMQQNGSSRKCIRLVQPNPDEKRKSYYAFFHCAIDTP